nr:allophanate hydrolase subunit 1 [Nocardioides flavescens]
MSYGATAVLAEVAGPDQAQSLAAYARQAGLTALEIVPGATTVLFDGVADAGALQRALDGWRPGVVADHEGPLVEVPVVFDGPDLAPVAERWDTDEAGVVERLTGTELVSAFCGFAPGFAYLAGLPAELAVPRLATPRPRVPAGSVAMADTWCGIYPSASPGGWRLVGRTDAALWDPDRTDPALLAPGTRVRLRPVSGW